MKLALTMTNPSGQSGEIVVVLEGVEITASEEIVLPSISLETPMLVTDVFVSTRRDDG